MSQPIRTRFAPSPTGYMHIGGMRTALFNWLFAKANGGTFVLRIDDTDQQRNVEAALEPILQSFRWLGLNWDEGVEVGGEFGPYYQSQRSEKYQQAVDTLLEQGKAFRDFDPPALTQQDRELAEKEKRPFKNIRRSLELTDEQIQQNLTEGVPHVVRLIVPEDQTIVIDDLIRGRVEFESRLMPDPVIMRNDGSALYNLATTVDDHEMQISHVIRAEEHLSNTPIQVLIAQALGWETPIFAHIPYVAAPGGKQKLSKRKLDKYRKSPQFRKLFDQGDEVLPQIGMSGQEGLDPVMVAFYEAVGYLPAGLLNALVRLGWSYDDSTEHFSLQEMIEKFTLDRVVKAPAGFDPDKLISFQGYWMQQLTLEEKVAGCQAFLQQTQKPITLPEGADSDAYLKQLVEGIGERLVVFSDVLKFNEFLIADAELTYDPKAFKKRVAKDDQAAAKLKMLSESLENCENFSAQGVDQAIHDAAEKAELGMGQIIHVLRVALTGKAAGIGLFDAISLLGKASCLARIAKCIETIEAS